MRAVRWRWDQKSGFEVGEDGEGRVVRGVVGVDFGRRKGKRVELRLANSTNPVIVRDKDKLAVVDVVGWVAADGEKKCDRWMEKNVVGE